MRRLLHYTIRNVYFTCDVSDVYMKNSLCKDPVLLSMKYRSKASGSIKKITIIELSEKLTFQKDLVFGMSTQELGSAGESPNEEVAPLENFQQNFVSWPLHV